MLLPETMASIASFLAPLYGIGAFIGNAKDMPISLKFTIAAQATKYDA